MIIGLRRHTTVDRTPGSKLVVLAVSLVLVLQSLAPPGYMAGSLNDGWPVVLCPKGLPDAFLGHAAHHHHEMAPGAEDLPLDGHCPLGSVFDESAVNSVAAAADSAAFGRVDFSSIYQPPPGQRPFRAHLTRAPPTST